MIPCQDDTFQLYSLGPNGLTRGMVRPWRDMAGGGGNDSMEWKPFTGDPAEILKWREVWGTPGDGNDLETGTGNIVNHSRGQDDIRNW